MALPAVTITVLGSPRWPRLSALLDEVLDLDAAERAARLDALRAEDAQLATELAELLAAEERAERNAFLAGGALDVIDAGASTLIGQTLGAYTIEAPLGAGGMGSVWLARRSDGRYDAKVAVKLLNLALLQRGGTERFAREGQALARLEHPNIARLLDAGVSAAGQPYLVLEHVEGETIDRWCDARALGVTQRLALMRDVLAAVAHAHSKLVLHRDLKPANILVTHDGQVKLLDFGIAKLIDDEAAPAAATELTQLAGRAFTPDFAAPEQVDGGDVTTATDVYALGVLLYLLLAGVHPTARSTDTPVQRLRSVVDTEPQRLSDAAAANAPGAAARSASLPGLAHVLRGDLDNICAKALKKAPAERYTTVAAFADDLRRYLAHEPVSARADSFAYRSAKFIRRHRLAVGAVALLVAALGAGVVGTTWQALEARRQRAEALLQRDRAQALLGRNEAIVDFIDTMFREALPSGQAGAIRQMLERSEPLIDTVFAAQPAQQAEVLRVLASYYTALSLPNKQVELLTRARSIVERVPDRSLRARLDCEFARAAALVGRTDEAARTLEPWLADTSIEAAVAAGCLQARAELAQNAADPQAALRYAQAGLERLRGATGGAPGSASRAQASLLGDIGFAQHLAGRTADADASYRAAIAQLEQMGRTQSFDAHRLLLDWGVVRYAMSDYRGGLELFERVQTTLQRQGDEAVPPGVLANRAFGLEQLGRYDDALTGYAATLEASRRNGFVGGEAYAHVGRASVLAALGQPQPAQESLDAAAALSASLPPAHSSRLRQSLVQARIDLARRDPASAAAHCTRVIDALVAQASTTPSLVNGYRLRAEAALQRGDAAAAREDADKALAIARKLQAGNAHSDLTGMAWLTLAGARRAAGDAAPAQEALQQAHAELEHTLGADHPDTRTAKRLLSGT